MDHSVLPGGSFASIRVKIDEKMESQFEKRPLWQDHMTHYVIDT